MRPRLLLGLLCLSTSTLGQESEAEPVRLSNERRFEVSGIVDLLADYRITNAPGEDGFDLDVRTLELTFGGQITPLTRFYTTTIYEDSDLDIGEAAVVFEGIGRNGSLVLGRSFLDFGKQMQHHRHELKTIERPLALRAYLGDWSFGDGLRYDNWFASGDQSAVRFSAGLFGNVGAEGEPNPDVDVAEFENDLRNTGSLGITARITGYADITSLSQFQVGASYRSLADFTFDYAPSGAFVDGLNNGLLGVDATFAWTDLTGARQWTLGTELLWFAGDIGATLDDSGTPGVPFDDNFTVIEDDAVGFYLYGDYGLDEKNSIGAMYSWAELPQTGGPEAGELDFYYTRFFGGVTEDDRLRFGLTLAHNDSADESVRFVVQYTTGFGTHPRETRW